MGRAGGEGDAAEGIVDRHRVSTAAFEHDQAVPRRTAWSRIAPHLTGWLFAAPWLVIFAVFLAIPIFASLALSFTDFGIGNLRSWFTADFVGFDNYSQLFSDERFQKAARNTAVFVVAGVPITIGAGLLAGLGQKSTALGSIIALGVWRNFGFDMVVFLAALQGINPVLYEAAKVDGATPWAIFRRITLPLLKPTVLFLAVITTAGYLQLFEEPFVMTGGGPLDSTLSVAMYVYEQGFRFLNLGYASAVAYTLFIAIVVLTFLQFRFLRSEEY